MDIWREVYKVGGRLKEMFINTEFLKNSEIQLVLERTVEGDEAKGWVPAYHYAGKACLLLFELSRKHNLE